MQFEGGLLAEKTFEPESFADVHVVGDDGIGRDPLHDVVGDGVDGLEVLEGDFVLLEDDLKENEKLHFDFLLQRLDAIHFISRVLLNDQHDLVDFVF